ncbi:MAG: hypothetical protein OEO20_11340 [Gemmatimonadota bacterium]|nr:hypothetical protein [Gemmatimonadota bacterium]MDH3291595.1 hypothetical protein [Gemmatimonadota bacterium]MDH3366498.1 hypothetical protein [Gemmatimonadota bacterium]MDH3478887.1 hypothetical protein [Gemmatimonadota bacterium]MDH3571207.1 hypothetical protein [Gemmatimonadota bacterium]
MTTTEKCVVCGSDQIWGHVNDLAYCRNLECVQKTINRVLERVRAVSTGRRGNGKAQ